jgi:hypothetical protein
MADRSKEFEILVLESKHIEEWLGGRQVEDGAFYEFDFHGGALYGGTHGRIREPWGSVNPHSVLEKSEFESKPWQHQDLQKVRRVDAQKRL